MGEGKGISRYQNELQCYAKINNSVLPFSSGSVLRCIWSYSLSSDHWFFKLSNVFIIGSSSPGLSQKPFSFYPPIDNFWVLSVLFVFHFVDYSSFRYIWYKSFMSSSLMSCNKHRCFQHEMTRVYQDLAFCLFRLEYRQWFPVTLQS